MVVGRVGGGLLWWLAVVVVGYSGGWSCWWLVTVVVGCGGGWLLWYSSVDGGQRHREASDLVWDGGNGC